MARYKVVVFDLDGTLLDTSEGLISSIQYTIREHGLKELDMETIESFIGPPVQNSFRRVYGFDEAEANRVAATFREHYKEYDLLKAKPYEGIYEVFDYLHINGIKPAIATYKRQDYATKILEHFGFNKYTNVMYGADFEGKYKKKDIIENALRDCGITDRSEAIMVGDSDNDAIGAAAIGTKFIGVTYGFGFKSEADVNAFDNIGCAADTRELIDVIREVNS